MQKSKLNIRINKILHIIHPLYLQDKNIWKWNIIFWNISLCPKTAALSVPVLPHFFFLNLKTLNIKTSLESLDANEDMMC